MTPTPTSPRPVRRTACLLVALAALTTSAQARAATSDDVRAAVETTWFHGVTEEIARREIGPGGVPELLRLLADPACPRRDNVVAFLHHLGGVEAVAALGEVLAAPPRPTWIPEEDRALLLTPRALGAIAGRGADAALAVLLDMTAPEGHGGLVGEAARAGRLSPRMRDDLVEQAVAGLAIAGGDRARERLARLASGAAPRGVGRDLRPAAIRGLEGGKPGTGPRRPLPVRSPAGADPTPGVVSLDGAGGTAPPPSAAIADPATRADEVPLSYSNHVDHDNPMTDARLDQVLALGTRLSAIGDFDEDVACCLRFVRDGLGRTFGRAGDGLDVIDDEDELSRVLPPNPATRVKMVRSIHYCGGPGTNIIGCAYVGGEGMALVRNNSLDIEAAVWVHEYGHNAGLTHNPDPRFIMAAQANGRNDGISVEECASYHDPPPATGIVMRDLGVCHDDDLDDVASSLDNCPSDANPDQADADGDGVGDVCDANSNCRDDDADGYGNPGLVECGRGPETDCDDADDTVFPGAIELCDGRDNDCDGTIDELTCDELDDSGDGRVDGRELTSLGRAFGACSLDPSQEWWGGLDYDRDGCVDGNDLAVLGTGWGCSDGAEVCR